MKKNGEYSKPAFDGESDVPRDHYSLPSGTILENLPLFNKANLIKFLRDGKFAVLSLLSHGDHYVGYKAYWDNMKKWNNGTCGTKFLFDYNTEYIGFDKEKAYSVHKAVLNDTDIHVYDELRDRCKVENEYLKIVYRHKTTDLVNFLDGVYDYLGNSVKKDLYGIADALDKLIKVNENANNGKGNPLTGKLSLHFKFVELVIQKYLGIFSCITNLTSDLEDYELRYKVEDYYGMESYEPGLEFFGALKKVFGDKDMIAKNSRNLSWCMKKLPELIKWHNETRVNYGKALEACKQKGILNNKAFVDPSYISKAVDTTLGTIIKYHNACNGKNIETLVDLLAAGADSLIPDINAVKKASTFGNDKDIANILHSNWIKNMKKMVTLPSYKAFADDFSIKNNFAIVGITEGKVNSIGVYDEDDDDDYMFAVEGDSRLKRENNDIPSNYAKWTVGDCLHFTESILNATMTAENNVKHIIDSYKKAKNACDEAERIGGSVKKFTEDLCMAVDGSIADYVSTLFALQDHVDTMLWYGVKLNIEEKY